MLLTVLCWQYHTLFGTQFMQYFMSYTSVLYSCDVCIACILPGPHRMLVVGDNAAQWHTPGNLPPVGQ